MREDLTGQQFNRLTVIGDSKKRNGRKILWLCRCSCGNETLVLTNLLKSGATQSCGCLGKERLKERGIKNGKEKTLIFNNKLNKNNTSGVKGVIFLKHRGKWVARIRYDYKTYHLCYSDNKCDCIKERQRAEEAIKNGEFLQYIERLKR